MEQNTQFQWTNKKEQKFQNLKSILCSDTVMLHHPIGIASLLFKQMPARKALAPFSLRLTTPIRRPVRYASRALQPLEAKWTTCEQELIAVVWACKTFYRYLWGKKFLIQTDHANLQWLQSISPQKPRLARWALCLTDYKFDIQHRISRVKKCVACAKRKTPHLTKV